MQIITPAQFKEKLLDIKSRLPVANQSDPNLCAAASDWIDMELAQMDRDIMAKKKAAVAGRLRLKHHIKSLLSLFYHKVSEVGR